MSHQPLSRPPLLASLSSSSSQSSSSLYTLPRLERPFHSLEGRSRLEVNCGTHDGAKPLPPVPSGDRRSSSDYSARDSEIRQYPVVYASLPLGSNYSARHSSHSTSDLLETQPAVGRWSLYSVSSLDEFYGSSPTKASVQDHPILLEPTVYTPCSGQHQNRPEPAAPRFTAESDLRHSLYSLGSNNSNSDTLEEFFDNPPPRPTSVQAVLQVSKHERSASTEKAKIALGVDNETLAAESKRRRRPRLFEKLRYHTSHETSTESAKTRSSERTDDEYDLYLAHRSSHHKPNDIYCRSRTTASRPMSGPLVPEPLFAHSLDSGNYLDPVNIRSVPPPLPPYPVMPPTQHYHLCIRGRSQSAAPTLMSNRQHGHRRSSPSSSWSFIPFVKRVEYRQDQSPFRGTNTSRRHEGMTSITGDKPVKRTRSQKKRDQQREALKASIRHAVPEPGR